jgi:hypothetical protein
VCEQACRERGYEVVGYAEDPDVFTLEGLTVRATRTEDLA